MRIDPTECGDLRIEIEDALDWARLELITIDGARLEGKLGSSLGAKMKMDDDWKSYVLPDIDQAFSEQIQFVNREINAARSESPQQGELHITSENVDQWYGALNQARLALETEHALSTLDDNDIEMFEELDHGLRSAIIKNHFYLFVQSHLLQHVMC